MHRYEKLEKRWKRYKLKRIFLISLLIFTLFFITAALILKKTPSIISSKFISFDKNTSNNLSKQPQKTLDKKQLYLEPNFAFEEELNRYNLTKTTKTTPLKPKKEPTKKPKNIIFIKKRADINILEKEFNKSPSYEKAIILAKKFYNQKNFKKSLKWAMTANDIDSTKEESWLIFAKSLAKLNQKEKAINLLKIYIKKSNSNSAKILLKNIEKGSFK